jgi:hypothetical protein
VVVYRIVQPCILWKMPLNFWAVYDTPLTFGRCHLYPRVGTLYLSI